MVEIAEILVRVNNTLVLRATFLAARHTTMCLNKPTYHTAVYSYSYIVSYIQVFNKCSPLPSCTMFQYAVSLTVYIDCQKSSKFQVLELLDYGRGSEVATIIWNSLYVAIFCYNKFLIFKSLYTFTVCSYVIVFYVLHVSLKLYHSFIYCFAVAF